ncbi:Lipid-binding putative hydrolase [Mucilaginibacter sp. OK268]|uniref:lipid-binding protein n=1 Tax=Mucilaginibacter sp. OK268 TaxID=1881048 RepID=UPI0008886F44|nr:lipid-binding protein [Mucilaginibacter sp. OK268]SDP80153.1 Lipid-binding putative hydrolase [Mucilaginibacter sp. OK268]
MKKINTIVYTLLTFLVAVSFTSCQKDEKIGGTAVQSLAGEYWVKVDDGTGPTATYSKISLYNTSSNRADSVWIDDSQTYYGLKAKIHADVPSLTFSATNATETYNGVKVTILGGKILKKAATAPGSKLKTDSIYFKAQYSDSPGVTFTYGGYARTGFDSDDH